MRYQTPDSFKKVKEVFNLAIELKNPALLCAFEKMAGCTGYVLTKNESRQYLEFRSEIQKNAGNFFS